LSTKQSAFEADIVETQGGALERFCLPRPGLRIHLIYQCGDQRMMSYMIMEYITLTNPPPDSPEPSRPCVHPLGAGLICHGFFKNHMSPLAFEALKRYINKVRPCLFFLEHPLISDVRQARTLLSTLGSLSGERMMFMQHDMDPSNFGIDES
jgi:hypothetical protein